MKRSRTIYDGLCELRCSFQNEGYSLQRNHSLDSLHKSPQPLSPRGALEPSSVAKKSKASAFQHYTIPRESLGAPLCPNLEPMEDLCHPPPLKMAGVAKLIPLILLSDSDTKPTSMAMPPAAEDEVRQLAARATAIFSRGVLRSASVKAALLGP